jgi:drug/metabolite transporter (DMT)-like permease
VGAGRWAAIGAGFLGMLVIVRPRAQGVDAAAWLVLLSALAYALLMLLARWMTRPERPHESTSSFVFYMLAGQAAAGWLVTLLAWRPPDAQALLEMSGMGVLGILGNYGLAEAFRRAPVAVVAPFEYTGLIWAVLLGAIVFGDVPAATFWVGTAVIMAAGLYTLRADPA